VGAPDITELSEVFSLLGIASTAWAGVIPGLPLRLALSA
jgi:hypothetical protein